MKRYSVISETLEYNSSQDQTNNDERNLVAGSRNVIIDQQRKAVSHGTHQTEASL